MKDRLADFRALGDKRKLLFRGVNLYEYWSWLIALAESKEGSELLLVSDNDVDFWAEARNVNSDAWKYCRPLREFKGKKKRLLILPRTRLKNDKYLRQVKNAIDSMIDDDIEVGIVVKREVPDDTSKDFGLIGNLAVSRFLNLHTPGEARTLEESFHPDDLRKAKTDWTKLNNLVRWKSTDKVPIDTVLKAEGGAAS